MLRENFHATESLYINIIVSAPLLFTNNMIVERFIAHSFPYTFEILIWFQETYCTRH